MNRQSQGTTLPPFETHNRALALPNGPVGSVKRLIISNRGDFEWHSYPKVDPPKFHGRGLLVYRDDEHASAGRSLEGVRRRTATIQAGPDSRLVWRGALPNGDLERREELPTEQQVALGRHHIGSTRNAQGELWWKIYEIRDQLSGDLRFSLRYEALDLVEQYHSAKWAQHGQGAGVDLDLFNQHLGHVMLVDKTPKIGLRPRGRSLSLRPGSKPGVVLEGVFATGLGEGAVRAYLSLGLPDAARESVRVEVSRGDRSYGLVLTPGMVRNICWDFEGASEGFCLRVLGSSDRKEESVYLLSGALVSMPTLVWDCLAKIDLTKIEPPARKLDYIRSALSLTSAPLADDDWTHGPYGVIWSGTLPDGHQSTWPVEVPAEGACLRGSLVLRAGLHQSGHTRLRVELHTAAGVTVLGDGYRFGYSANQTRPEALHLECGIDGTGSIQSGKLVLRFDHEVPEGGHVPELNPAWIRLGLTAF